MSLKDALVGFLFWISISMFVFMVISIDSWPLWFVIVIAIITWIAYVVLAIREHEKKKSRPTFWMKLRDRKGNAVWTAMDGSGRTRPIDAIDPRSPQDIYDQEEEKI